LNVNNRNLYGLIIEIFNVSYFTKAQFHNSQLIFNQDLTHYLFSILELKRDEKQVEPRLRELNVSCETGFKSSSASLIY